MDDIGTEDFVKAYGAPGNNSYMMYGYVKDYPLNALWGFKYGGVWKNQDEVNRNKATLAYASHATTTSTMTEHSVRMTWFIWAMPILGFTEVYRTPSVSET